jgi:hypothetical protein
MAAPEEVTVEQVVKRETWTGNDDTPMLTYELLFVGDGRTYKWVKPASEDPGFQAGQTVKGWRNPDGKFGVATGKPSTGRSTSQAGSTNGRRDDPTGVSIERQVAAKAAAEMAVAAGGDAPTLIANFEAYFDIVATKIAGTPLVKTDAS